MDQKSPVPRDFSSADDRYKRDVRKLREDAIRMQKGDGGKLSDTHKTELRTLLEKLNQDACAKRVKVATCPAGTAAN